MLTHMQFSQEAFYMSYCLQKGGSASKTASWYVYWVNQDRPFVVYE